MSQQQRGGPRARGRGPGPGQGQGPGRGRGSSPSTRGRGSPAPSSAFGTEHSGTGGGHPPRGSSPARSRGISRGSSRGGPPGAVFAPGQPLNQDARLADPDLNQLVQSFKRLNVQAPDMAGMPLRPGWGTRGQPGALRTNFFSVRLPRNATFYEYEISINPQAQAKGDRRFRIMQLVDQSPQFAPYVAQAAHDRSQRLVSVQRLPQPLDIPIVYLEEDQAHDPNPLNFTVEIKFLSELKMSDLDRYMSGEHPGIDTLPLVSALNLILQKYAQRNGVRVSKTKYFFPSSSQHHHLSLGVEAFRGFFMSVRPMYKQLTVNINVCMTAFYVPGPLATRMDEFLRQTGGAMPNSFFERLKVSSKHLGYTRKYTIHRIMTGKTARGEKFNCEEYKGMISVEDFFKRKYRITLRRHSDLPLINVSGNRNKPIYLPAEICEIVPGQAYRGKLDPEQTAAMIKIACNPPEFNGNAIANQGFADLGLLPNTPGAPLAPFGITVSRDMQVVPYRILPAPNIAYRSAARPPRVQDAGWNILDVKFQVGGNMANWAVLVVNDGRRGEFQGPSDPELTRFLKAFVTKCNASGIAGARPDQPPRIMGVNLPPARSDTGNRSRAINAIREAFRANLNPQQKPSFVLVLLSGVDRYIYPGIKQLADVQLGLHTVHMLLPKARNPDAKKQDQYFSNVALKVNAKLGGVNHTLDMGSMGWLTKQKTMVMGIDVTHAGPTSTLGTPSIAAVVASVDDHFVQFPASLMLQKPDWNRESKEMVEGLTQMTIERLQLYKKKNKGTLPDRIIVFRDGVSEGQYAQVIRHELPRLQAAFKQISPSPPYKPKLSIIVCGKRHHARFWPPDSDHATRNGNTRPGTVVDKGITEVYLFDFYLQAHNGLQGHVKATHYVVIYDENKLDADTIQQGTHTASYLYARATKAVSLVPAAYYADIACERGREYLNVLINVGDDRASQAARSNTTADREALKEETYQNAVRLWGNGVHRDLKDTMFYI